MSAYLVRSPVLFLIFNRPDVTLSVFNQIRAVRPSKLYVAADGPRRGNPSDVKLISETRSILNGVDWECDLKILYRDENLGCKMAVYQAISWFFNQEKEGIVLEDDCLPCGDFFRFCDLMLEQYRYDTRIHTVSGTNFQQGIKRGQASYYFSRYNTVWGWASWRRVWAKYDVSLSRYETKEAEMQLRKIFSDDLLVSVWLSIFTALKLNTIDTWDFQLTFMTFFENALCVVPNVNLVSNIGFGPGATHTADSKNSDSDLSTSPIGEIVHPIYFLPDGDADKFVMKKHLNISWSTGLKYTLKKFLK